MIFEDVSQMKAKIEEDLKDFSSILKDAQNGINNEKAKELLEDDNSEFSNKEKDKLRFCMNFKMPDLSDPDSIKDSLDNIKKFL